MSRDAIGRRAALRAGSSALAAGLAGCVDSLFNQRSLEPPPFGPLATDWRMDGFDPANTGHSPAATGPIETPEVEWEVRPSTDGSPRVAVAGTLLVVVGDEAAVAFDLEAGERRWSVEVNGPTAPALDDGGCYVATEPSRLRAYERVDGSLRWTVDADTPLSIPVLSEGTLFVAEESGRLRAIDAASGDVRWTTDVGDGVPTGTQMVTDGTHVVTTTHEAVVVLDADDGTERWREGLPCCSPPAPVVANETVYTIRHELSAWAIETGDRRWAGEQSNVPQVAPTVDDTAVYTGQHALEAIDVASGQQRWRANGDLSSLGARSVCGTGTVYVALGGRRRRVAAVDAGDGTVRWNVGVDRTVAKMAVVGEWLLACAVDGSLYALTDDAGT